MKITTFGSQFPMIVVAKYSSDGTKSLRKPMLIKCMTHFCVTRPQWIGIVPLLGVCYDDIWFVSKIDIRKTGVVVKYIGIWNHNYVNEIQSIAFQLNINDFPVAVKLPYSSYPKNIEIHTVHTIHSWPNPKQWVIVHTFDLMMIKRQSIYILSIITKGMGKLKHTAPHIV